MTIRQSFSYDGWTKEPIQTNKASIPGIDPRTCEDDKWETVRSEMQRARIKKETHYNEVKKERTETLQILANRADAELDGRTTFNRSKRSKE